MQGFPVFVAAPYGRAQMVRDTHGALLRAGCQPLSEWAELASGPECLDDMSARERELAMQLNHAGILRSGAMLVLSFQGEGGEMFADVARGLLARPSVPVIWTGDRTVLSAFHQSVYRCLLSEGMAALRAAADVYAEGASFEAARKRMLLELMALRDGKEKAAE